MLRVTFYPAPFRQLAARKSVASRLREQLGQTCKAQEKKSDEREREERERELV